MRLPLSAKTRNALAYAAAAATAKERGTVLLIPGNATEALAVASGRVRLVATEQQAKLGDVLQDDEGGATTLAELGPGALVGWDDGEHELGADVVLVAGGVHDDGEDGDALDSSPGTVATVVLLPKALVRAKLACDDDAEAAVRDSARALADDVERGRLRAKAVSTMRAMQADAADRLEVAMGDATSAAAAVTYENGNDAVSVAPRVRAALAHALADATEVDSGPGAAVGTVDLIGVRDGEEDYFNHPPEGFDQIASFFHAQTTSEVKGAPYDAPHVREVLADALADAGDAPHSPPPPPHVSLHAHPAPSMAHSMSVAEVCLPSPRQPPRADRAGLASAKSALPSISLAMAEVEQQLIRARVGAPPATTLRRIARTSNTPSTPAAAINGLQTPQAAGDPVLEAWNALRVGAPTPLSMHARSADPPPPPPPALPPQPPAPSDAHSDAHNGVPPLPHLDLVTDLVARLAHAETQLAAARTTAAAWKAKCAEERRKRERVEAALHALTSQ